MKRRIALATLTLLALAAAGWTYLKLSSPGEDMTKAAQSYLATLSKEQKATSQLPFDTEKRVGWHFIPKDYRKGLQIKNMNDKQRKAAHALLRASLSEIGYDKSVKIMELESVLRELEKNRRGGNIRDPERYYFTVFGDPQADNRWGLSIEGHHLSLNFVVDSGKVVSSTPTFFAANPGIVKSEVPGVKIKKGTRVLAKEEQLAFDLVTSFSDEQKGSAVIAEKAPREIRAAGEPQPPTSAPEGIAYADLSKKQQRVLHNLIGAYAENLPSQVAQSRLDAIEKVGPKKIHFAWAGPTRPGIGHYYRVQGPTFLIEFVNTQPDAAGNPANHIHCVWRDPTGDFAIPIEQK